MEANIRDVKIERYYPDVLSNSKDFIALCNTINPELTAVRKALWKQMLNTFVYDIDIDGAKRWESMLKLYPKTTDSLEIRRRAILAKINSTLPYTFRSFQTMLNNIYGHDNVKESVVYNKYELWLDMAAAVMPKNASARRLAHIISPANLTISVSNTKRCDINQYYGCAIVWHKHTTINASKDCNFNISINTKSYRTHLIRIYKHTVIGGK